MIVNMKELIKRYITLRDFLKEVAESHPGFGAANLKALCHQHGFPWSIPMQASAPGCRTEGFYSIYFLDILKYILDRKKQESRYAPIFNECDKMLCQALRRDESLLGDLFHSHKMWVLAKAQIQCQRVDLVEIEDDDTPDITNDAAVGATFPQAKINMHIEAYGKRLVAFYEYKMLALEARALLPKPLNGFRDFQLFVDLCETWGKSRDLPEICDRAALWAKELNEIR